MTELVTPLLIGQRQPTKSYFEEADRQLQQILDLPLPGAA